MINKYNLKENERLIVELLVTHKFLTRAELARKSGLNRSTISYITKDLESRGYINLTHEENNGKRSGTYLALNLKMQKILFIDY
ncbi:MAG: helix-turn-helix transcriptional regulator, partial [Erysipelotrichaceae bacterium]